MTDEPAPELVVARLRPHARRLVRPAVFVVLVAAAGGFGFGVFRAELAWLNVAVAVLVVVLVLLGGVVPLLRWMSQRYVVTTRRLVVSHGLGTRTRRELLHSRGYDVTVRRQGAQGLFRSGDVLVFPGEDPALVLTDVPHADLVVAVLHDLVEAHEARRRHREPDWDDIVRGTARHDR
ncbi:PH domain-containing protein [Curtobacterium sp. MCPF17_047]|uniref:PH domain-containing protein n=1 Tax=unclassified Curtobacterium TaxID=257496 RepID=UPI000DA8A0D8|nr:MULTISPECIES: PH domain-containing protein [unclassified Curtobacterium]PZE59251.1 PH domain-containing protein [Curtobacterium sp. MCPF17_001]PZF67326.1 PH domain-containing protein [Curtobacterium sp. MCPF17_047]